MAKDNRKAIRKDLLAQLAAKNYSTPMAKDLVDRYLEARDRMLKAQAVYAEMDSVEDADPEALAEVGRDIDSAIMSMTAILTALQVTPASSRRAALENQIRAQLAARQLSGDLFEDKIDQFMKLWDAFQDANRSLLERGRTYFTVSSAGKNYEKDNSATKDLVSFAKAMQDILDSIGVNIKGWADPEDNEL